MNPALTQLTVKLLLFRGSPADLPANAQLTGMVAAAAILLNYVILRMLMPAGLASVFAVFGLVTLTVWTWLVLRIAKLGARFVQTLLAMVLVSCAFSALSLLPALGMMQAVRIGESPPVLPTILSRLLTLWNLGVMAHVFREALDSTLGRGLMITLGYFVVVGLLFYSMFLTGA